ncbi:MAG TPA: 4Fe-4S binding protein [Symbiobacteriaceae bacterium]|jgi:ferredoxin|nr:4Fe-4S binding protein [Symbiobacteriaceae bacterium]
MAATQQPIPGKQTPPDAPNNLLDHAWLKAFLKSRWFPAIFAYPTLVVFAYIVYALLWGPTAASANLGTSLTWVLWWPLIPIFMFLMGRLWCAICPFATVIDLVQAKLGLGRPVPAFLKKYGIWIIDAVFITITWADHVFGIVESPRGSGYLLGLMVTAVVVTGLLFERRAWCRYLCFLGGLSGNYSRSSAVELRATPEICATCTTQNCYKGDGRTAGCPIFEFPRTMQTSANCNLCANCIKTCPNDSIRLTARIPTKELWFIARPKFEESFLAVVIVGIVLVQNITMLSFWVPVMDWLTALLFGSKTAAFTAIFLVAMALPFGLTALASRWSGATTGETFVKNFARFGYAVIPLDLAGHIAHNMFHLLAEGKAIYYNVLALFGANVTGPAAVLSAGTIQILQFIVLGLGIGGSIFTAYKIAKRNQTGESSFKAFLPHLLVLILFGLVNIYLFTLPMTHRV